MKSSLVVSSRRTRPFHLLLLLPSIFLSSSRPLASFDVRYFLTLATFPFFLLLLCLCGFSVELSSFLSFLSLDRLTRNIPLLSSYRIFLLAFSFFFFLLLDDDRAKIISFECAELIRFLRDLQPLR